MGIFDAIRNRFGRKEDAGFMDVRSQVLGENPPLRESFPTSPEEQRVSARYPEPEQRLPSEQRFASDQRFSPPEDPFERRADAYGDLGPPSGNFTDKFINPEPAPQEGNYEILDKLKIIEAQLHAIRAQTETINERLKNLEMRMPRRY